MIYLKKHCGGKHPYDFELFTELINKQHRKIVSCIPGVSTHGETQWLSPLIDWETEININTIDP